MQIIKTILADDHRILLEGLKTTLSRREETEFEIVGLSYNGQDLIRKLKRTKADLLILGLNMPQKDGLEVMEFIRFERLKIKALVFTMYDDAKLVKAAFKAGAGGYILKNKGIEELFVAIDEVMEGNTYLGEGVSFYGNLFHKPVIEQNRQTHYFEDRFIKKHNLTKRELEILRHITLALSNKEIARELFISDQTVSVHRKNIMRKLGVCNTAGLIKMAYDNSLV